MRMPPEIPKPIPSADSHQTKIQRPSCIPCRMGVFLQNIAAGCHLRLFRSAAASPVPALGPAAAASVYAYAQVSARIHAQLHIRIFVRAGRVAYAHSLAFILTVTASLFIKELHLYAILPAGRRKQRHPSIHHRPILPSARNPGIHPYAKKRKSVQTFEERRLSVV